MPSLFSPDTAVKIFLGAFGLNGVTGIFTPKFHLNMYQMTADNFNVSLAQECTGADVAICFILGLQIYAGIPFTKAVGWSTVPYTLMTANQLLTGKYRAIGKPDTIVNMVLANNIVVYSVTLLVESTLSLSFLKVLSFFSFIMGVPMLLAPTSAAKTWGLTPRTFQNTFLLHRMGMSLLAHALAIGLPAFRDLDPYTTTAWIASSLCASLVGMITAGVFPKDQMIPGLVWAGLLGAIATSLL